MSIRKTPLTRKTKYAETNLKPLELDTPATTMMMIIAMITTMIPTIITTTCSMKYDPRHSHGDSGGERILPEPPGGRANRKSRPAKLGASCAAVLGLEGFLGLRLRMARRLQDFWSPGSRKLET